MPWAIKPSCPVPGCPHKKPCPVHARKREWRPDTRQQSQKRGYGTDWKKQRIKALLRDDYTCQRCGRRAVVVHHIVELPKGNHDLDNLSCLCRECHEAHHGRKK